MSTIRATTAVDLLNQRLQALAHPTAGMLHLTMFAHQSDGVKTLKRQVAEAIILLLEDNGYHLCNGLSEAQSLLESLGYVVTPPGDHRLADTITAMATA